MTASQTKKQITATLTAIKKLPKNSNSLADATVDLIKDDLPSVDNIIRRKIGDFQTKVNSKKLQNTDIFGEVIKTAEQFLGITGSGNIDINQKPRAQNRLKKYATDSAKQTLSKSKQIVMDEIKNNFFGGSGVCGTNVTLPLDTIELSPKEFDLLNMLVVSPNSGTGAIMYEDTVNHGHLKMNRELYTCFDSGVPYVCKNNNGVVLFNIVWNGTTQKYTLTGLQGILTVQSFLTDYFSAIEYPDLQNIIKQSMLLAIQDDGNVPNIFKNALNYLERLLQKLFAVCSHTNTDNGLNQNPNNQFYEDDIDMEWYFNFDDVEGIDVDEESARLRGVMKFVDCNNFEIPVNRNHIEDFVYFSGKGKNYDDNVSETLNKIAAEAYEKSGQTSPFENFQISLFSLYILKIPKALVSAVLSPKIFLPIVILYKEFKPAIDNIYDFMKKLSKLFYNIIKKLFWSFITSFWGFIKKDLLVFIKEAAAEIIKNKLKRLKTILSSLIALLTKLLSLNLDSCEAIYSTIMATINAALNTKIKLLIPNLLLGMSDKLPGYSDDKAFMNIIQKLDAVGIQTGPLYGRENKLPSLLKSNLTGYTEIIDRDSYLQGTNKEINIPGVIYIPPGLIGITGKGIM